MISKCPAYVASRNYTRMMCADSSNYVTRTPVTASNDTVFKNIYCAYCNGYFHDLIPWNASYICFNESRPNPLSNLTREDLTALDAVCHYFTSIPKSVSRRECTYGLVDRCPKGYPVNDINKLACERYALYVQDSKKGLFKNEHCVLCHGRVPYVCGRKWYDPPQVVYGNTISLPNYDTLFDLIDNETLRLFETVQPGDDSSYILKTSNESLPDCSNLFVLRNGDCTFYNMTASALPQLLENSDVSTNILTVHLQTSDVTPASDDSIFVYLQGLSKVSNLAEMPQSPPKQSSLDIKNPCFNSIPESIMNSTLFICKTFSVASNNKKSTFDIMEDISNFVSKTKISKNRVIKMDILIQNHALMPEYTCTHGKDALVEIQMSDLVKRNDKWYAIIQGVSYKLSLLPFFQKKMFTVNGDAYINVSSDKTWVVLCKSILPNCSKIFIENKDYILYNNKTIFMNNYNLSMKNEEYDFWDSGIITCIDYLRLEKESSKYKDVVEDHPKQGVVTLHKSISIACSSISLLALFLTFLTYCYFPSIRTLPGKCVMSLTMTLFFAQLMLLTSDFAESISSLCLLLSVIQHYCWLAAFTWLNVLSLTVFQIVSKSETSESKMDRLTGFRRYSAFAWTIPLLTIIPCMTFHFLGLSDINYTSMSSCWLKDGNTVLLFFAVPVGLMLLMNISVLVGSMCFIHKSVETAELAGDLGIREQLNTYVRLSTILGFIFVVWFLSPLSDVLAYVFSVLNGLQGVAVFASFVLRRSVSKLVKQSFVTKE